MAYGDHAHLDGTTGRVIDGEMPLGLPLMLAKTTGVDLKSAGQTTLYTVPTGKTLYITEILVSCASANTVAVPAIVRVGKASAYNEWAPLATLTNLTAAGTFYELSNFAISLIRQTFAATEVVKVDVQTGATATTLTADFIVFGFLL